MLRFMIMLLSCSIFFGQEMHWRESEDLITRLEKELNKIEKSAKDLREMHITTNQDQHNFVILVCLKETSCENFEKILIERFVKRQMTKDDPNLVAKITLVYHMIEQANRIKTLLDPCLEQELYNNFEEFKKLLKPSAPVRKRCVPCE